MEPRDATKSHHTTDPGQEFIGGGRRAEQKAMLEWGHEIEIKTDRQNEREGERER